MKISAHDLTKLRLCRAAECGNEAEPYSRLCWTCQRREHVRLHTPPPPAPPTLRCLACGHWKPDQDFGLLSDTRISAGGSPSDRRGRFWSCRACDAKRKRASRAKRDPA